MSIKHGSHTFNIDPSTTDTYRHYHEGEVKKVAMAAPDKFALVERWSEESDPRRSPSDTLRRGDRRVRGIQGSALPKIEMYRTATRNAAVPDGREEAARYMALVTERQSKRMCPWCCSRIRVAHELVDRGGKGDGHMKVYV